MRWPMTWRMFCQGPRSKGFSPGLVERMAKVREGWDEAGVVVVVMVENGGRVAGP